MGSSSSSRRRFTPEYRREAARLVLDTGRSITEVAREIGLVAQTLNRWVAEERAAAAGPGDRLLDLDERAELERLRTENQQLRMEVEFLGKASAFFASRSGSRPNMS